MKKNQLIHTRAFVTLSTFLSLLIMLITSVLMFSTRYDNTTALVHTLLGFLLISFAAWHLMNNINQLKQYFISGGWSRSSRFRLALPTAAGCVLIMLLLNLAGFQPFVQFYQWGTTLRVTSNPTETTGTLNYLMINKQSSKSDNSRISVDMRKGPAFLWPQYAIWLESLDGKDIYPLYVTSSIATNNFTNHVTLKETNQIFINNPFRQKGFVFSNVFNAKNDPDTKHTRIRPESLPVFLHRLGIQNEEGMFVPHGDQILPDAVTGATMKESFVYRTQIEQKLEGQFLVRFEINQSFDFNDYYRSDKFPDDPIYSGSGFSGQPSVVYEALVDFDSEQKFYLMHLVGHSHHSGADGKLYTDLINITTAKQLVDRIVIELQ